MSSKDESMSIAVKRIELNRLKQDEENHEEVALSRLNHPNVVKLIHVEQDLGFK